MIKIIIGIIFIIGGLSGNMVLIGTNSGVALAGFGAVLIVWGIVRMVKQKQARGNSGGNPPTPPSNPTQP